jgi:SiaC family regulatory phosphoprotein
MNFAFLVLPLPWKNKLFVVEITFSFSFPNFMPSMESLVIEATSQTPKIAFDATTGSGEIIGTSFPESAFDFYACVFEWTDQYFADGGTTLTVTFNLNYFNTATNKVMRNMMKHFYKHYNEEKAIQITWYYEDGDDDMEDMGRAYSVNLSVPVVLQVL